MIRRLILLPLLILFASQIASAQTVEELMPKIANAVGGIDRVRAVKTQRITAKMSFGPSDSNDFVVEFKRPDKIREQITTPDGKHVIRGFNGSTGWQVNPYLGSDEPRVLSAEDTRYISEEADLEGPVIGYKEEGNKIELVGKEPVNGSDAFKLKVTMKNGDVHFFFYDCKTYLKVKWEATRQDQGKDVVLESFFGDYREVGGLKYPFSIKSDTKGEQDAIEIETQKIEVNVPLDDKAFDVPASGKSALASPR